MFERLRGLLLFFPAGHLAFRRQLWYGSSRSILAFTFFLSIAGIDSFFLFLGLSGKLNSPGGETREETRSYSTAFFRLKRKRMWQPALALEPDLVLKRLHDAIAFMIQHAQTQRDRVALLLLNQTGARLSEILGLTVGGYRKARHACRALVTNKGSLGCEEKTIYFTPEIECALHLYIRTERVHYDPQGRKRLEELADHEPIFLTRRGTPYTRSSWYYHWNQWLASIPPDEHTHTLGPVVFTAHDIRHVFVSRIIRQMKRKYAHDATKQAALQWALQQRMGWRSHLTVLCYDHSESDRERLEQFDIFLREIEQHQDEKDTSQSVSPMNISAYPTGAKDPRTAGQDEQKEIEGSPSIARDLGDLAFWEIGS